MCIVLDYSFIFLSLHTTTTTQQQKKQTNRFTAAAVAVLRLGWLVVVANLTTCETLLSFIQSILSLLPAS
jgi:hypothetical protein